MKTIFLSIAVFALVGIMVPLGANAAPPEEQCIYTNQVLLCNFVPQSGESAPLIVPTINDNCTVFIGEVNSTGERTGTLSGGYKCTYVLGILADDTQYRVIGKI